jgi:hypothetical protein
LHSDCRFIADFLHAEFLQLALRYGKIDAHWRAVASISRGEDDFVCATGKP